MKLDGEGAVGPRCRQVGPREIRISAGQSCQSPEVHGDRVGTGLAGASGAAALWEQGYNVKATSSTTARGVRTHCGAGGINAAKKYQNDGDSVYRSFTTRSREATTQP